MKKILALCVLLITSTSVKAQQWLSNTSHIYSANTGNVGIGISNPLTKLHLNGGPLYLSGNNGYGGPMILLGGSTTTPSEWGIECITGVTGGLNFWRPWTGSLPGNYFMYLQNNNGHVGINTNNAKAQLTVNGDMLVGDPNFVNIPGGYKLYVQTGILTEKVKVAVCTSLAWSDHVFKDGYKRMTLTEVEDYVSRNKHLPGIPSAEEMVKEGLDLGAMDAKLLEKIEELTLYMIEQEKVIKRLENELVEIKKR